MPLEQAHEGSCSFSLLIEAGNLLAYPCDEPLDLLSAMSRCCCVHLGAMAATIPLTRLNLLCLMQAWAWILFPQD